MTNRGSLYFKCTLSDKSGEIPAVCWEYDGALLSGVIHVVGSVTEYRGGPQVKIESVLPRISTTNEDFERVTEYNVDEMWARLCGYLYGFEDPLIRSVACDIMLAGTYEAAFKQAPAASKYHHAFQGGLLEHTVQLCDMADKLFALPFISDQLNRDLCFFGLIFHDFGKIFEYEHSAGFSHTLQGTLVPHIPMTGAIIYETCNKRDVPEVIRDHLMHVVLAHHGKLEYGSPVDMAIPEAAFVHYLDNMHGDIFGWLQKFKDTKQELIYHNKRNLVTRRFSEILKEVSENIAEAEGGSIDI